MKSTHIDRKHEADNCTMFDVILCSQGTKCMNCGVVLTESHHELEPGDEEYELMKARDERVSKRS